MSRNPITEAYLRGLGVRQANMPRTEIDALFNPYTYTGMDNATRVASNSNTMMDINEIPDNPLPVNPQGADPLLFKDSPIKNTQPKVNQVATQSQMSPYDQFQKNIKENVYNPTTNEFEPTTYLLDRIAPTYSQKITDFMTGATPDMSQAQLDAIQANVRNIQAQTLSNPVRAAMNMQARLPDIAGAMGRSGAEQEEFDRRQADAQRRADRFDAFVSRERTRNLEDSLGLERGSRGGQPTAFEPGGFFSSLFGGGDDGDSNSIFNF